MKNKLQKQMVFKFTFVSNKSINSFLFQANDTIDSLNNIMTNESQIAPKPPPRTTSCKSSASKANQNSSNKSFINIFNSKLSSQSNNKEQNNSIVECSIPKTSSFMRPFHSKPFFAKGKSRPKSDMFVMSSSEFPHSMTRSRFSTFDIPVSFIALL
jgi:hypothetical protein